MEKLGVTIRDRQNLILRGADPITKRGFAQVPVVILQHKELSDTAKLVYAMMLYYAWHKNYCFPGQARLAKDLGVTSRTIIRAIRNLEESNILETRKRGLGKTNIYILWITPKGNFKT